MKKNLHLILIGLFCTVLGSCSQVVLNYGNPTPNSGHIVIKTNYAVYTNLTLNDSLLLNGKHVKSITIKNVPEGINSIHFSANSQNYTNAIDNKLQIKVEKDKTNTQLITVPPKSNGYWISQALTVFGFLTLPLWFH